MPYVIAIIALVAVGGGAVVYYNKRKKWETKQKPLLYIIIFDV